MSKDADLIALGQTVRRLRNERGLTQEALADRAGLSANYVSEVERGVRNLGVKSLCAIAHALQQSPSALFEDERFRPSRANDDLQ